MKTLTRLIGAALLAVCGTGTALASFVYTFEFDAVGNYGAASFQFENATLLQNVGDSAVVAPTGDLNGYAVNMVTVNQRTNVGGIAFTPDGGFFGSDAGTDPGDVIFFLFSIGNYNGGTGVFTTPDSAGRNISSGPGMSSSYRYTSGTLTIQEVSTPVPEPASLALVGAAIVALAATRRRKR